MAPQPPTTTKPVKFKTLSFGFASADFEASQEPDLLLRGFVDPMGLVDEARNGRKSLLSGR
jgi:hypothetical protein